LDIAVAPPPVGEELAERFGSCTAQPWRCSQHNQQETLEATVAEMAGFCEDLFGTEDQNCESDGPSLWPFNKV